MKRKTPLPRILQLASGTVTVTAIHVDHQTTTADAQTAGADAGAGASVAVTADLDSITASLGRNLSGSQTFETVLGDLVVGGQHKLPAPRLPCRSLHRVSIKRLIDIRGGAGRNSWPLRGVGTGGCQSRRFR